MLEQSIQCNDERLETAEVNNLKVEQDSKSCMELDRKQLLHLKTYSRRAGIPEQEQNMDREQKTVEDTQRVLLTFL